MNNYIIVIGIYMLFMFIGIIICIKFQLLFTPTCRLNYFIFNCYYLYLLIIIFYLIVQSLKKSPINVQRHKHKKYYKDPNLS